MSALGRVSVVAAVAALAFISPARAGDDHQSDGPVAPSSLPPGSRVGVLLLDHGEPPEYNAWTYESFRQFFVHLIEMGIIPSWLAALDSGTVLVDRGCPFCPEARPDPDLMDAWLRPHDGPAAFVPESDELPPFYVKPGGPGLGEPDIFEIVGVSAWDEWRRMGGRSPNYDEKLPRKEEVARRLRAAYGDTVAIRIGYGMDPRINGGYQGVPQAVEALVNRDRVDALVVAYHGVGFSDIMQTHMLRPAVTQTLESLGRGDMPLRFTEPMGTTEQYLDSVVAKVEAELAQVPDGEAVALHLSGHGLSTTACGDYDCGADAYHEHSRRLFARTKAAIEARVAWSGRLGIFRLYGEGGDEESDPDDEVDSPEEALAERKADGYRRVIDIPFEFDSNSRDTLIVLRRGYEREAPDWNATLESNFERHGMRVKIANASGSDDAKVDAYEAVIGAALEGWLAPTTTTRATGDYGGHALATPGGAGHGAGGTRASAAHAAHEDPALPVMGAVGQHPTTVMAGSRGDHVTRDPAHRDDEDAAQAASHEGGGTSSAQSLAAVLVLGLLAAAAVMGAALRGATSESRLVLAGLAVTFGGLAIDVAIHAGSDHPFELLENPGHWVALIGLILTTGAASRHARAGTAGAGQGSS